MAIGPRALAQGSGSRPEYLIVVIAEGGWDVTFAFDPKYHVGSIVGPEVDEDPSDPMDVEGEETHGGITIAANPLKRPAVSEFFQRHHSRSCVVNGIWMGSIAHDPCRFRILTGTQDGRRPDLATVHGYVHGGERPLGSVDLSGWSLNGPLAASSGRVGANSQILPLVDPGTVFTPAPAVGRPYPIWLPDNTDQGAIADYLRQRTDSLQSLFGGDGLTNDLRIGDLGISLDRAGRFRDQGAAILKNLSLGSEATLKTQIDMTTSLLKDGLCRAVTIDSRKAWDTHDSNFLQHEFYNALFLGLNDLVDALEVEGLLDKTLVCVLSEMTRTPAINAAVGKDHWGHTSALLIGAGVRGSTQLGGTDEVLESLEVGFDSGEVDPKGSLNKYENMAAGILSVMDIDPAEWLPGVTPYRGFST